MKKTIIIIATIIAASTVNFASAQDKRVSFGLKLNGNLTNVKVSDLQGSEGKFHGGASLGGFTRIHLTEILSLQPELMFNYTEATATGEFERLKFKYVGVEIPVYLQANIKAGTGKVVLGAGPHIGYGLSADTRVEKLPQGAPGENVIELDHWYAGGGVTAGYELRNGISVNAGYQMGFDIASRHKSAGMKTQTVSLGIGYRF